MSYSKWLADKRLRDQLSKQPSLNPKLRNFINQVNEGISWSSSSSSFSTSSSSSSSSSSA